MLDAIIFDGEGVVLNTEGVWDLAQAEFLLRYGRQYDRAIVKPLVAGRSQADGIRVLKRRYGLDGSIESLLVERQSLFWKHLHDRIEFIGGFEAFSGRIGMEFKRALATSIPRSMLDVIGPRLQLERHFGRHIYSESDIKGPGKPAPDLFLFAAGILGADPAHCIVIEDSPIGIEAARRAGMRSIGLASTFPHTVLQSADLVVDHWADLNRAVLEAVAVKPRKGVEV